MLEKLQTHTVKLYELNEKKYRIRQLPAKELIVGSRFDLWAKLFYAHHRKINSNLAKSVYLSHIMAFNPDGKEPGREDKTNADDFLNVFDALLDYFENHDFDNSISLIPVSSDGVILDGSHRTAALAYYNKLVTVVQFEEVHPVCHFDYQYFLKRGFPISIADLVVESSTLFSDELYVACLWPKMGTEKEKAFALQLIDNQFDVLYVKKRKMSLRGLSRFMYEIYKHQDWVGDANNDYAGAKTKATLCFSSNAIVHFVVFKAKNLEKVLLLKSSVREHYHLEKHALHITDNSEETQQILNLILGDGKELFGNAEARLAEKIAEWRFRFTNIYWLNFKIMIAAFLNKIKR